MTEEYVKFSLHLWFRFCSLNFHTVVPYLDLLISNGLMERVRSTIARYRTTAKGGGAKVHEGSEKSKSFEVNIISVIQRNVHDLLITREDENDSRIQTN